MTSRGVLNLAMLAVVVVLAWLTIAGDESIEAPERAPLTRLNPLAVTRIKLIRNAGDALEFSREAQGWMMQAPIAFSADGFLIDGLLGIVHAPAKRLTANPEDDAGFGLSPPEAVLRMDETDIRIGAIEPLSRQRYIALAGALFLIDDAWYRHLFSAPERYLDPRPAGSHGVPDRIRTPQFEWRQDNGLWRRSPPDPSRSADDAQRLAERWASARAVFVDSLDGRAQWSGAVNLRFASRREPLTLRIARRGEVVLFGRDDPPIQYQLSKAQAARLLSDQPPN